MILPSQKHLFDIPDSHAYLNTAYMSPLMYSVVEAMKNGVTSKAHPWTYRPEDFFTPCKTLRALAARIFNSSSEMVALIPSASYGIQIAANALPLRAGQEVLVLEHQFPSNIYPWQEKAKRCGANVRSLPTPDDGNWTRVVLDALSDKTAILALPHTHWVTGATLDLEQIGVAARKIGAALVLDLTQSLGAQPFDVNVVKPDFAVAATYKWLLGPYSSGFVYIDPKWHGADPLEYNWINRDGAEDFSGLVNYTDTLASGAIRFDMGEKSNPVQLGGAIAALTQILDWGVDNIADTLSQKTRMIVDGLAPLGVTAVSEEFRAPHFLGLEFPDGELTPVAERLSDANIFVSIRGRFMRVTPHLYTSDADIERFLKVVTTA